MHIESINLYNTCINFNAINILNDDNDVRYNCTKKVKYFHNRFIILQSLMFMHESIMHVYFKSIA